MSAANWGNSATGCQEGSGSSSPGCGGNGAWQRSQWLGTNGRTLWRRSGGSRRFRRGGGPGCPPGFFPGGFFGRGFGGPGGGGGGGGPGLGAWGPRPPPRL